MATRPFLLAGCFLPASRSIIGRPFFAPAATTGGSAAGGIGSWRAVAIGLLLGGSKAKDSFAEAAPIAPRIPGVSASTAIVLGARLP